MQLRHPARNPARGSSWKFEAAVGRNAFIFVAVVPNKYSLIAKSNSLTSTINNNARPLQVLIYAPLRIVESFQDASKELPRTIGRSGTTRTRAS